MPRVFISPCLTSAPQGFGPEFRWKDYESPKHAIRLHPLAVGSPGGFRNAVHRMGFPVYGSVADVYEYQLVSVAYAAVQYIMDPRKIRGADGIDYWRPTGWLHEERAPMPIFPHFKVKGFGVEDWFFENVLLQVQVVKVHVDFRLEGEKVDAQGRPYQVHDP